MIYLPKNVLDVVQSHSCWTKNCSQLSQTLFSCRKERKRSVLLYVILFISNKGLGPTLWNQMQFISVFSSSRWRSIRHFFVAISEKKHDKIVNLRLIGLNLAVRLKKRSPTLLLKIVRPSHPSIFSFCLLAPSSKARRALKLWWCTILSSKSNFSTYVGEISTYALRSCRTF